MTQPPQRPLALALAPLAFTVALALTASCGTTLLEQRVERSSGGWTVALTKLRDGPNAYERGNNVRNVPAAGTRFLWAWITLRNDQRTPQVFNYDRCDLDDGGSRVLPGLVDRATFVNLPLMDTTDQLDPAEQLERRLIFSFPVDRFPTRLACGDVVIPLPRF